MRNVNAFGLVIVGICIACSVAINFHFGLSLGENVYQSAVYSMIGVAAVIWEATALHRIDHLKREGRTGVAAALFLGLITAALVSVSYEFGYLAELFEGKASVADARSGDRSALEAERKRLEAQIEKAGIVRPVAAIEGDLAAKKAVLARVDAIKARAAEKDAEAAKASGMAKDEEARKGCGDICRGHLARSAAILADKGPILAEAEAILRDYEAPPTLAALAAELGTATALRDADKRIREIAGELRPLADAKAGDARASYLARLFGTTNENARIALALVFVFFLWLGRTIGPWAYMDGGKAPAVVAAGTEKKPIPAAERGAEASLPALPAYAGSSAADDDEDAPPDLDLGEIEALWELENEAALLEGIQAPEQPPAPIIAEPPLDEREKRIRDLVQAFIDDCLLVRTGDPDHREGCQFVQDGFRFWLGNRGRGETVSRNDFGIHMSALLERLGGRRVKSNGRYYVGIQMRPAFAADLTQWLADNSEDGVKPEKLTDGRRLGGSIRRRDEINGEAAGTA